MMDSILLYAGLGIALVGGLSVIYPLRFLRIRTRRRGALVLLGAAILIGAVLAIPPTEKRAADRAMLLDEAMPVWQFAERHSIEVNAPPDRAFDAIRRVTADDILLFRTLIAIRRGGRRLPEGILNAPEREPILDVATRTSFVTIADEPPRELVVGTVVVAPAAARRTGHLTRDLFYRKLQPGMALAAMNFFVTPIGANRSRVVTETRVYANTPATARRFAVYWRLIHPGSDIIRRMWLRAVKKRAEGRL